MENNITLTRQTGLTAILGSLIMIAGAACYFNSGADLWVMLSEDDMAGYNQIISQKTKLMVMNQTLWIIGALLMGLALRGYSKHYNENSLKNFAISYFGIIGASIAVVAFFLMMTNTVQLSTESNPVRVEIARVFGYSGARLDDLATSMLVGFAPCFVALCGRSKGLPSWSVYWGFLCGILGVLSLAFQFSKSLEAFAFMIVPVGILWMLTTGIYHFRKS